VISIRAYTEDDWNAIRRVHDRAGEYIEVQDLPTATKSVEITETGRYAAAT
jgi:hypothetical protein